MMHTTSVTLSRARVAAASTATVLLAASLALLIGLDPASAAGPTAQMAMTAQAERDALEARERGFEAAQNDLDDIEVLAAEPVETAEIDLPSAPDDPLVEATLPGADSETVPVVPIEVQVQTFGEGDEDDESPVIAGGTQFDLDGVPMSVAAVPDTVAPDLVTVSLADQHEAETLGITGVVLDIADASEPEPDGPAPLIEEDPSEQVRTVQVGIDYTQFAAASGGDWASRLQLVALPECFEQDPDEPGCAPEPVESVNDTENRLLYATVEIPAAEDPEPATEPDAEPIALQAMSSTTSASRFALAADVSGGAGDWSATSLGSASAWDVSGATGAFTWSYPMRVPAAPGGLAPEVALSYSAASVDGRTAGANNQTSWVGEGWDLWPGYVERSYVPCADDTRAVDGRTPNNAQRPTADLCWGEENATIVFGGLSSELIRDEATGQWKPRQDDGTRIEVKTGASNGTAGGEYWVATTSDGVQYFFGREQAGQDSAWTVPVYGNHPGEPGHAATFGSSSTRQGWRWNLDRVLDPAGNEIHYFYSVETNRYGRNLNSSTISYDRGGWLTRIEYGTNTANTAGAPARVVFDVAERCLPNAGFDCTGNRKNNANKWPDVPTDLICTSTSSCVDVLAPVFFTTKRLVGVTTQVRAGSSWRAVDTWDLVHRFPRTEDSTNAVLWLNSVRQSAGTGSETLPEVQFRFATPKANRIDVGFGRPPLNRFRLESIRSELGAVTTIGYSEPECTRANTRGVDPADNTRRCFPVDTEGDGNFDWFHKYVTTSITEAPGVVTLDPSVITRYEYHGDAAWARTTGALLRPKQRTYADFRGYEQVSVTTGEGPSAEKTTTTYFRGMGGQVDGVTDRREFAGMARQVTQLDGSVPVSRTVNTPWRAQTGENATGVRSWLAANRVAESTTFNAAGNAVHTTRVTTEHDPATGLVTRVHDAGDITTGSDDTCTTYTYAPNTAAHLLDRVSRELVRGTSACTQANTTGELLGDQRTYYDGATSLTAAPTRGEATRVDVHGLDEVLTTRTAYDAYGRVTSEWDENGHQTMTAYTPATGAATTTTVTSADPDGSGPGTPHVVTTQIDPAWGVPTKVTDVAGDVTTATYDGLGRLRQVWLPDRPTSGSPSMEHTYHARASTSGVVTHSVTAAGDGHHRSSVIIDGLGRQVQTQSESKSARHPGLVATDTRYDAAGRTVTASGPWFSTRGVGNTFLSVGSSPYPSQTDTTYDAAGRVTREEFFEAEQPLWATTTTYDGASVKVTPPAGSTPSTTVEDARGQVVSLTQHTGSATHGDLTTRYTHDRAGNLTRVVDPDGNQWTYTYDILGREIREDDPDAGVTTTSYTPTGQPAEVRDARGVTVRTTYDALDRVTGTFEVTGSQTRRLTTRVYDTVQTGQLSHAVSHDAHLGDVVTGVSEYDVMGRALGEYVELPDHEDLGALGGQKFESAVSYTADGQVASRRVPAVGNLRRETVSTIFDAASMPEWMSGGFGWGTYVANSRFTPLGEVELLDVGNTYGTYVTYAYEEATRRLAGISLRRERASGSDVDLAYSYDAAGNVTSMIDAPGIGTADAQCFAYDGLRRLTQAWTPAVAACSDAPSASTTLGGPGAYWTSYEFDAIGNRTAMVERDTEGVSATYTYSYAGSGGPHALAGVDVQPRLGAEESWSYTYDPAGNTTTRPGPDGGVQELNWDAVGRLETVTITAGDDSRFAYSADGERLIRTQGEQTTVYLPGGQEATITPTGEVEATRWYEFAGATVALRTAGGLGGVESLLTDQHGSVLARVHNTTRAVIKTLTDPYGNLRGGQAPPGGRGLMNKVLDDTTGLTQVGARYYDQLIGRFISVDPVMDLTDPQQWHGYTYANNNPTTWNDPTGLLPPFNLIDGNYQLTKSLWDRKTKKTPTPPKPPQTSGGKSGSSGKGLSVGNAAGTTAGVIMDAANLASGQMEKTKRWNRAKSKVQFVEKAKRKAWSTQLNSFKSSAATKAIDDLSRSKYLKAATRILPPVGIALSYAGHKSSGDGNIESIIKTGVDVAGVWAGAKAGAAVGAAVGTIFPGAGTAIGAGIGAVIGGAVGYLTARRMNGTLDEFFD